MMIQIEKGSCDELLLSFNYNSEYIDKVRTIKGRKWNSEKKYWTVPNCQESVTQIRKMFDTNSIVDHSGFVASNYTKQKPWSRT